MFRPIILFLSRSRSHITNNNTIDCQYQPVAFEEPSIYDDENHLHPLLLPLVISKIGAELSSVNDLCNFRLVCTAWNVEGTRFLQKKIKYLKVYPRKMYDFLQIFKQSTIQPSKSYSFYVDHPEHMYIFRSISENLYHCMTSLRLSLSSQEIPNLPKILQNLSTTLQEFILLRIPEKNLPPPYRKYDTLESDLCLPQLKSLSFRNMYPSHAFICNYDNFIIDIINSAEQLTCLEFQNWRSSLQQIFRFSDISSLETLVVSGLTTVKESELDSLKKRSLNRLKNLTLTLSNYHRDTTLTEFLETLKDSLESIEIICDAPAAIFPIFCSLPQLKSLTFQSWRGQISLDNFLSKFPLLEKVTLLDFQFVSYTDYGYVNKDTKNNRDGYSRQSLVRTVFARPCCENESLTDLNLASIITAFPHVKNFTCPAITDSMCALIFQYWKNLEYLDMQSYNGKLTDFGITGMVHASEGTNKRADYIKWKNSTEKIPSSFTENSCSTCKTSPRNESYQRVNNYLGDLHELKYLHLRGSTGLTNASLQHGILKLKKLKEIQLPDDACHWCFECMATKMKNLQKIHVDPNNSGVNPQDLIFLKDHIPNLTLVSSNYTKKKNKMT